MQRYQRRIRNQQIERALKRLNQHDPDKVRKGPHDVSRFICIISCTEDGEVAVDHFELDKNRIAEEEKYDGFYAVATNLDDDVRTILSISGQRWN